MKNAYNFPKTQGYTFQRQRVRTQKMYDKIFKKKGSWHRIIVAIYLVVEILIDLP